MDVALTVAPPKSFNVGSNDGLQDRALNLIKVLDIRCGVLYDLLKPRIRNARLGVTYSG